MLVKVTLPLTTLNFLDLGGQRGIMSTWHRYYEDYHAVVYAIGAQDRETPGGGWVKCSILDTFYASCLVYTVRATGTVLSSPREQTRYAHEHIYYGGLRVWACWACPSHAWKGTFVSSLPFPLLVRCMGCTDKACVRQLTEPCPVSLNSMAVRLMEVVF